MTQEEEVDGRESGAIRREAEAAPAEEPAGQERLSRVAGRPDRVRAVALFLLVVTTAVLCALMLATTLVYIEGKEALLRLVPDLDAPQPTAAVSTQAVVLRTLDGASELATAVYTMETIVTERLDRKLGPWTVGDTELIYVAYGQVKAGVDLSGLQPSDVSVDDGSVTIQLGPPEILDAKIDVDRSYVYDLDRSLFGPIDPDLQSRAERYALKQIMAAACESGLLEEARRRADLVVRSLVEPLVDGPVQVEVPQALPDGCRAPVSTPDDS